jgi:16S rRNA (guanine527-N7)-methyltransferase
MTPGSRTICRVNTLWSDLMARAGLSLTDAQSDALERYLDLLDQANQRMNLTRINDRDQARIQHVGDALTLLPFLGPDKIRIADVGSGGGVPGIPLAIVRPDCQFRLIESTRKKAAFLSETAHVLDLKNLTVLPQRAEEVASTDNRERFDVVIARAVGQLVWLAEWCLPLTRVGGKFLAMKGAKAQEEIPEASKAIKLLGGAEAVVHPVQLPGADNHVIVAIRKIAKTAPKYPRDPTATRGNPLT